MTQTKSVPSLNRTTQQMKQSKSNAFAKVYYIWQTTPSFRCVGYSFQRKQANAIANQVRKLTGQDGKIVEFDRAELTSLKF